MDAGHFKSGRDFENQRTKSRVLSSAAEALISLDMFAVLQGCITVVLTDTRS